MNEQHKATVREALSYALENFEGYWYSLPPGLRPSEAKLRINAALEALDADVLAQHWPSLEDVPEGNDVFSQYPISGK